MQYNNRYKIFTNLVYGQQSVLICIYFKIILCSYNICVCGYRINNTVLRIDIIFLHFVGSNYRLAIFPSFSCRTLS